MKNTHRNTPSKSIQNVALAGASGYSGQVLEKLLRKHPHFKLQRLLGREEDLSSLSDCQLAFLCTPPETSLTLAPQLLKQGLHVVDLSGAFRLKSHDYQEWYSFIHSHPAELAAAHYGLFPFAHEALQLHQSRSSEPLLVANPGCYASACLLALIPVMKSGLIDMNSINIDAKSGTSGAGKKAQPHLLHSEIFGNFYPYRLGQHQHWPEIVEALEHFGGQKISFSLVTELLPIERGISICLFGRWASGIHLDRALPQLFDTFKNLYSQAEEVEIGGKERPELLSLKRIQGSPGAQIHISEAYGNPLVFVTIDNLMRGAASQALSNANVLAGRPYLEGLL